MKQKKIVAIDVDVTSLPEVTAQVRNWTESPSGHYVCVSNVHMCMEAYDDPRFATAVNGADLTVPDGRPLVWAQRLLGERHSKQVRGYDLGQRGRYPFSGFFPRGLPLGRNLDVKGLRSHY